MFKEFVLKLLLRSALAYERDKEKTYRSLAGKLAQPHLRELALKMADEEREHIRHIEGFLAGDNKHLAEAIKAAEPAEAEDLGLDTDGVPPVPGPDATEEAVLAYLRGRERAAHRFFALLAKRTLIPAARDVFSFLAREEARQMEAVERLGPPGESPRK